MCSLILDLHCPMGKYFFPENIHLKQYNLGFYKLKVVFAFYFYASMSVKELSYEWKTSQCQKRVHNFGSRLCAPPTQNAVSTVFIDKTLKN